MRRSLLFPIVGTLVAIAITTVMDATGYTMLSALPLMPLMALFWYFQKLSRKDVGFVWGRRGDYLQALLHPLVVIGAAALAAVAAGAVDTTETNWQHFWLNLVGGGLTTVLVVILTEEGFFRGWPTCSSSRRRRSTARRRRGSRARRWR